MTPVQITVLSSDRLFTVIANKWKSSKYNKHEYKPAWFVSIRAVMAKAKEPSTDFHIPEINWIGLKRPAKNPSEENISQLKTIIDEIDDGDFTRKVMKEDLIELIGDTEYNTENSRIMYPKETSDISTTNCTVEKYIISFAIPYYVDYQMSRLASNLCRVHLTNKEKDDLLQSLYWQQEEAKLCR
jgi:hypothetical protein